MAPEEAVAAADVYKDGSLAGRMWRVDQDVTFAYVDAYDGPPVASTLPVGATATETSMRAPAYFAGLLPEGETRRRSLARALHVTEDDELGLLIHLGADTIGDVQIVEAGAPLPEPAEEAEPVDFLDVSFSELWLPEDPAHRAAVPGVQPKLSYHSRSLIGGRAGHVILKFSPDDSWHGVLHNEQLFMTAARDAGLDAPDVVIVEDRDGLQALAVTRFDRSWRAGEVVRHAQEDASQVLGLRPSQKYDPDAHAVVRALSQLCTAPPVAARDLLHQMLYSYAVGDNDLHAKNLSIGQDPVTGTWSVTPVYDVLHTWPYEGDHRFHPAVRGRLHGSVSRRHWLALAADVGIPEKVAAQLCDRVSAAVGQLTERFTEELLDMPEAWVRDVRRRVIRRVRDLAP
ncbi:MAG: HipA domain-containing protein [Nitriliruptoraceae bacterium]